MTEWGYGGEVVGLKGFVRAAECQLSRCLSPSVWTQTFYWHLFWCLQHNTQTHTVAVTYTEKKKLALLLTPAVLGSCGIGHGNEGYCLPHTNHTGVCVCVFTFISRIVKISVPPPVNPNPLFFLMEDLLWPILKASPAMSSVDRLAPSPPLLLICSHYPVGRNFMVPQSQSLGFFVESALRSTPRRAVLSASHFLFIYYYFC